MSYSLFRDLVNLTEEFEKEFSGEKTVTNFSLWLYKKQSTVNEEALQQLTWEGKDKGRSMESVINTSFVHLFRYAKVYSKIAVANSPFATLDEVIFLINLLHSGGMSKIQLIELNIHEKSTGIQIINRLLQGGFIKEDINDLDKRSKKIEITEAGKHALEESMPKIRSASKLVVGNLNESEKAQLISLLQKLELFHKKKIKEEISL